MHQVFAIFLRDVKRILKNPVALVVTLGVAIIPSLYAWCNILANWDPYANTGNIQVAVANEDKGTTSTLVGHLDAGQQTVNQLKKNHQLGWRFVPEHRRRGIRQILCGDRTAGRLQLQTNRHRHW